MTVRRFLANVVLPVIGILVIVATLVAAPADDRTLIFLASLVAMGAGLAATSIGVYGGVLVPGLLLLGVDARFAAAASLFLQLLVIPLGVGAHHRLGNVNRAIATPLILGGMAGAFMGPFFAAALPSDVIARLVAAMIVFVGVIVLATLKWGGLGEVRPIEDVPTGRIARRRRRGRLQLRHLRCRLGTHRREAAHPAAHRAQGGHRLIAPGPCLHGCRRRGRLPHHGHGLQGRGA